MVGAIKFLRNDSGHVGVIFALAAVPLLAFTSAAVDYSQLTKERNAISSALDAAVLAAANNNAIAVSDKDEYARTHFLANYSGDMELSLTPSLTSDRVRLSASGELDLTFGNMVGINNPKLVEASAASLKTENTICILSLSKDADSAISFDEELAFTATGCSIHSNSNSSSAIQSNTFYSKPTASSFCAVGGVMGEVEPHAKGECSPVADPYISVPPAKTGVCKSEFLLQTTEAINAPQTPNGKTPSGETPSSKTPSNGGSNGTTSNYSDAINLPAVNPVPLAALIIEVGSRSYDKKELIAEVNVFDENTVAISTLHGLTGYDLRELLQAYDAYGEFLDCNNNPVQSCYGFNNPYLYEDDASLVPSRSLVAEVFDISFGDYFDAEDDVPNIVKEGVVELIDGQLYSRNNLDNELIPVSANLSGGNIVLTPGTYCGGLTVDGLSVRFTPGDYIFKDGPLTFLNKSQASADKVTFGFTGNGATLNIESGSALNIRSATTGPRKGLAFMQMIDRNLPGNRKPTPAVNRVSSGGTVSMSGTAYFPEQSLIISGENTHLGANSPAVGLIADTIAFRGQKGSRVNIGVDHVKAGIPPIEPRADDGVRLVE